MIMHFDLCQYPGPLIQLQKYFGMQLIWRSLILTPYLDYGIWINGLFSAEFKKEKVYQQQTQK